MDITTKIKSELMNEALEELKDDIYQVTWKTNPIIWYKSRQIIKYAKEKN